MLVKLADWEAKKRGVEDGVMHVNMDHVAYVFVREDGQPFMRLDTQTLDYLQNTAWNDVFAIEGDSYRRIVEWLDAVEWMEAHA